MTSAGGPVPAGTLRMVRAMACAYDAHRIHTDGVRGGGTEKGSAMTAMPPNDRFDRFDRFSKLVPRFDHLKWKMAAAGILVGLISGFLVVLYRLGIEYGTDTARWIYARIRETPWLVAPWAVAAIAAALAIAWMVKKEPMAGGSGIPQTNGVVICGLKMRWQTDSAGSLHRRPARIALRPLARPRRTVHPNRRIGRAVPIAPAARQET